MIAPLSLYCADVEKLCHVLLALPWDGGWKSARANRSWRHFAYQRRRNSSRVRRRLVASIFLSSPFKNWHGQMLSLRDANARGIPNRDRTEFKRKLHSFLPRSPAAVF